MERRKLALVSALGALALLLCMAGVLYLSSMGRERDVPKIVLPDAITEEEPSGENSGDASGLDAQMTRVEITPDNVRSVVATMARPENYSAAATVTLAWSSGSVTQTRRVYVKDGFTKVEALSDSGHAERHIITDDTRVFMWNEGDANYYRGSLGDFSADDSLLIPTYEAIADLPDGAVTDASYTLYAGENCIYIASWDETLGESVYYWISLDSGLLIHTERVRDELVVYTMTLAGLQVDEVADTAFRLPNNVLATEVE